MKLINQVSSFVVDPFFRLKTALVNFYARQIFLSRFQLTTPCLALG